MANTQRLFIGFYPAGIRYADRERSEAGDYKKLAFLSYASLLLTFEKGVPQALKDEIRRDAAQYQTRCGELLVVSETGQIVKLGQCA